MQSTQLHTEPHALQSNLTRPEKIITHLKHRIALARVCMISGTVCCSYWFVVKHKGKVVRVSREAQEAASIFHARSKGADATFKANFWRDWRDRLPPALRDSKLGAFTFVDKRKTKAKSDTKTKKPQTRCTARVNGITMRTTACAMERPGLFVGRGKNPQRGRYKRRVHPEQVTINVVGAPAPRPPSGHSWAAVVHDAESAWLARWKDPVTGRVKYVYPASGMNDEEKFDRARRLGESMAKVRRTTKRMLRSPDAKTAQTGLALCLLDVLAIRIGGDTRPSVVLEISTKARTTSSHALHC